MLKIFTILLSVLICLSAYSQISQESFKLSFPKNIPLNTSFDLSLVTSNRFPKADTLELYVLPGRGISLNAIHLNSLAENISLNYDLASLNNYTGTVYKSFINLKDTSLLLGSFFQLMFNFDNNNAKQSSVKLLGVFKNNGEVLGYFDSRKRSVTDERDFIKEELDFYEPQGTAGKSLSFGKNSLLRYEITISDTKRDFLNEFWLKSGDSDAEILTIKNNSNLKFNFAVNRFQVISCYSKNSHQVYANPGFISLGSWNHVAILFSFSGSRLYFYCNEKLYAEYKLPVYLNDNNLVFEFGSSDSSSNFQIDQLRFINFGNSIQKSFKSKNHKNFRSDSSFVISQFNFDNSIHLTSKKEGIFTASSNLQLVKSSAPIFARAPELNIKMHAHSYELIWSGGDFKQADKYVLEKSSGKSEYKPIFEVQADNRVKKNYSFLDVQIGSYDIVYYRIKQIDKDGSVVYSSQVKVGQGKQMPFAVRQNYPNPFNPKTSIVVELYEDTEVKVIIYNLEGKEVAKLFDGSLPKGVHKFSFDASNQPSGVYLYKVETPKFSQTKKMILTK